MLGIDLNAGICSSCARDVCQPHLRFFIQYSNPPTCQALESASQLLVVYARGFADVCQAEAVNVVEQHQHHRLQPQSPLRHQSLRQTEPCRTPTGEDHARMGILDCQSVTITRHPCRPVGKSHAWQHKANGKVNLEEGDQGLLRGLCKESVQA